MILKTATDADALSAEVEAILKSKQLINSPALSALLTYLKDRHPDRSSDPTTEYSIAQDVLGHDASFDPKTDPNVRVRVRRLRDALADYYKEKTDGALITIPSRGYDLKFTDRKRPRFYVRHVRPLLGAGAALCVVALLAFYGSLKDTSNPQAIYPLIRVLPVENLTGDPANDIYEDGLQRQLGSDLYRFGRFRVVIASPSTQDERNATFTLRGSIIRLDQNEIDLAFRLESASNHSLVYSARVQGLIFGERYYAAIAKISAEVSGQIAGQGGPTSQTETAAESVTAQSNQYHGVGVNVFQCIVLKDQFFDTYGIERYLNAYRCFEAVLSNIGDDPISLTSWGTLVFHSVPEFNLMQTEQLPPEIRADAEDAHEIAKTIIERFPESAEAFLLLGSIQNSMGLLEEAEVTLRQSISLNPAKATTFAELSYLSLSQGKFEDGMELAENAVRLSAEPQSYLYLPIFLSALVLDQRFKAIDAGTSFALLREGDAAIVVRLVVARLTDDQDIIEHLSPVVAAMPDPFSGFGGIVRSAKVREALEAVLPEIDFETVF